MARTFRSAMLVAAITLVIGAGLLGAGMALGGAGLADPVAAQQADDAGSASRTITVSASSQAGAAPDEAVVRVTVEATAEDPTVARQRVARNASSLRSALSDLGLAEDAVRTTGYDLYQDRVRPPERGEEPARTYRVRHSFAVEVDDPARVGSVIDTAVDNGATGVHGVRFTLEDDTRDALRDRAIERAMADARSRAGTLAEAGGLTVTGVQTIQEGGVRGPRPMPHLETADGGAGGGTAIESGPVSVRATVTVTYTATG